MKRKAVMVGLAMVTGLPYAAGADGPVQAYPSWNSPYMLHYGVEGAEKPLMDHVSVAGVSASAGPGSSNTWRLEFTPLPAVSSAGDPVMAKDVRAGFSLKLDF